MASRIIKSSAGRAAHVRALACALFNIEAMLPPDASTRRVQIRDHISALLRAYPHDLAVSEVDLAQAIAEEDGDALED